MVGPTTPLVVAYAVIRFRRSDFIEARYAFSFVFANFGIAIAAKMPMITTTIRSSIRVKPFRFFTARPPSGDTDTGRAFRTRREAFWSRKKRAARLPSPLRDASG